MRVHDFAKIDTAITRADYKKSLISTADLVIGILSMTLVGYMLLGLLYILG